MLGELLSDVEQYVISVVDLFIIGNGFLGSNTQTGHVAGSCCQLLYNM